MVQYMSMRSPCLTALDSSLANRVLIRALAMILITGFLIMDCLAPGDEYTGCNQVPYEVIMGCSVRKFDALWSGDKTTKHTQLRDRDLMIDPIIQI